MSESPALDSARKRRRLLIDDEESEKLRLEVLAKRQANKSVLSGIKKDPMLNGLSSPLRRSVQAPMTPVIKTLRNIAGQSIEATPKFDVPGLHDDIIQPVESKDLPFQTPKDKPPLRSILAVLSALRSNDVDHSPSVSAKSISELSIAMNQSPSFRINDALSRPVKSITASVPKFEEGHRERFGELDWSSPRKNKAGGGGNKDGLAFHAASVINRSRTDHTLWTHSITRSPLAPMIRLSVIRVSPGGGLHPRSIAAHCRILNDEEHMEDIETSDEEKHDHQSIAGLLETDQPNLQIGHGHLLFRPSRPIIQ